MRRGPDDCSAVLRPELLGSDFAESYRALRANIVSSGVGAQLRTVVVASATTGDGRTTTALNLGIVMAHSSQRVIVVDAGVGRPGAREALWARYGWELSDHTAPGLAELVACSVDPAGAIVRTPLEGLSIVPRGSTSRHPSELLGSERMGDVLAELAARADCVLVDSPPCVGCAGAWLVAGAADAVLYVVRAGVERAIQRQALDHLRLAGARILGSVFNDVDPGGCADGHRRIFAAHAAHLRGWLLRSSVTSTPYALPAVLGAAPGSGPPGRQISRRRPPAQPLSRVGRGGAPAAEPEAGRRASDVRPRHLARSAG